MQRHYIVRGKVQGVFFRRTTRKKAQELDLTGWVRNIPDGAVEISAQGGAQQLEAFESFLHEGPPRAEVEAVEADDAVETGGWSDFAIR